MRLKPIPSPSTELLLFPESDKEYIHFEDAQSHPFDHGAQGFSRVNAWWLADAALLAYWDEGPARSIWRRAGLQFEFLSEQGVQCHIGWNDAFVIVAFRGTQPNDWRDLLDIARVEHAAWEFGGGSIHKGFLDAHNRIWPSVESVFERFDPARHTVWFTGHSLGAALATLSMDRFGRARGLYTIGSPPIGDRRFARGFNGRHVGRCFRYVNHHDIVVHLPTWLEILIGSYKHVQERKYIDAQGGFSRTSPSIADWLSIMGTRAVAPQVNGGREAARLLPLPVPLVDHTPRRYAVHIWNDLIARTAS